MLRALRVMTLAVAVAIVVGVGAGLSSLGVLRLVETSTPVADCPCKAAHCTCKGRCHAPARQAARGCPGE